MKTASLEELKTMKQEGKLHNDRDAAISAESLGADFWSKAAVVYPKPAPHSVHLKLDPDVFEFFKRQGKGHLTKMQDVLRAYVRAHLRP